MAETRKLAAILAADVVGYSRLAGADEDRILARLRSLRSDLIDPTIAVHNGRVVKRTGDGALVEFRSVVDAVRCAIEVQNGMVERNAGLPRERRIDFRIGIHLGDVVEESDGDLMGDGVNIAARLEGIAEPGAICLSEQAYWQVKGRLDLAVTDLGATRLKNIAEPVRAYSLQVGVPPVAKPATQARPPEPKRRTIAPPLVAAIVALIAIAGGIGYFVVGNRTAPVVASAPAPAEAPRLSLVVLPFTNLSNDPEQDYFADGLTDDLTTDLSHLPDSFVIARNTAFTYKGKAVDVKQIGRELGVRYVLEGSVRRLGEAITVNAQLISTETGAHVWADRFEGDRGKLGELQVDFVARLARSLGVELVKAESLRAMRERPNNPDAVDLSMRGWAKLNSNVDSAVATDAAALFERALALDAQNVSAMIGLADALTWRVNMTWSEDRAGDIARAEAAIDRALALEPDNSSAHEEKGHVLQTTRQWAQAVAEEETAIADDSNNAAAHASAGFFDVFLGRSEDGLAGVATALRLSPRDPLVPVWQFYGCNFHSHLAQWEQAIEWCNKAYAGAPALWYTLVNLAAANAWTGRDAEARAAVAGLLKLIPGFTVRQYVNIIKRSENPTYQREILRIGEGLRKAGLPEE
jgi:adenylate cyclase